MGIYSNIALKIILSIVMVYIAFKPQNAKTLTKELILFYLVSFVFGGCAFALLYWIKPQEIFMVDGVYIGTYPVKIVLLGAVIGFGLTYTAFKIIKNKLTKKGLIYEISIKIDDKDMNVNAMLDTGNMLKDPITDIPVIIVEKEKLYDILPKNILDNIQKIIGGDWEECKDNIEYRSRFKIIPFTSIGRQNGMLLGFKVDEVKVFTDTNEIINKKVIVCIYNEKLTKNDSYSALIGLDILEGRDENEFIRAFKI